MPDLPPAPAAAPPRPVPRHPPARGGRMPLLILLLLAAAAGAGGFLHYRAGRPFESTDDAFVEGHVAEISAQIAAPVLKVAFKDNQEVARGDLLAELDPRDFQMGVADARARQATAEAGVADAGAGESLAQAGLGQAEAELESARASSENAEADLKRNQSLDSGSVISKREFDNAVASARTTRAALRAAEKKVLAARSQQEAAAARSRSARADVGEALVRVRQAELQLSYTRLVAPSSGRIARKNIEPGMYAQPGQALCSIVSHDVWVIANFKETQLRDLRPGQPAEIQVDSLGGRPLQGVVDSLQDGTGARFSALPPENATGNYVKVVQRVPVKIRIDEPPEVLQRLAPGMSVVPKVRVR